MPRRPRRPLWALITDEESDRHGSSRFSRALPESPPALPRWLFCRLPCVAPGSHSIFNLPCATLSFWLTESHRIEPSSLSYHLPEGGLFFW
ncbi:hypothetical protein GQ53DRAFT_461840 [Thozetella sp. PMI_491]|nr:hypothetical protein GQ53DRAFT_461840 [Thozetella sp. PMI_491]